MVLCTGDSSVKKQGLGGEGTIYSTLGGSEGMFPENLGILSTRGVILGHFN